LSRGSFLGTAGAIAAGRALQNQLFQTVGATVLLVALVAVAVLAPARRATRLDPLATLRSE
jgi:ABC-type lipoprotein release transport system permease subunit